MKGLVRTHRRSVKQQPIVKMLVPISAVPVIVSGATGVGFGTAVIGDFPEGNILFLGAVSYIRLTKVSAGAVLDNFDGDYSIGSTPTADATINGTDADIVGSTPFNPATAGISPTARGTGATQVVLDNTDGSLELNLNVLIDDASISAIGQELRADGHAIVSFIVLGDD